VNNAVRRLFGASGQASFIHDYQTRRKNGCILHMFSTKVSFPSPIDGVGFQKYQKQLCSLLNLILNAVVCSKCSSMRLQIREPLGEGHASTVIDVTIIILTRQDPTATRTRTTGVGFSNTTLPY